LRSERWVRKEAAENRREGTEMGRSGRLDFRPKNAENADLASP
jgi:hypothetical protein